MIAAHANARALRGAWGGVALFTLSTSLVTTLRAPPAASWTDALRAAVADAGPLLPVAALGAWAAARLPGRAVVVVLGIGAAAAVAFGRLEVLAMACCAAALPVALRLEAPRALRLVLTGVTLLWTLTVLLPFAASQPAPPGLPRFVDAATGWASSSLWPEALEGVADGVAVLVVALGAALWARAGAALWTAGGGFDPNDPPRALCTRGPYQRARHPMQLAQATVVFGAALWWGTGGALVAALAVAAILWGPVQAMEDAELRERFGDEHAAYAARTRARWWG